MNPETAAATAARSERFDTRTEGLIEARRTSTLALRDQDRIELRITPIKKAIGDATVRMLGYGGSVPGPTLRVQQGTELAIDVINEGDLDATVHWHGLRLDNRFDGTTETQAPMPIGGDFTYELTFPDPGVYWYHPHIREDYGQEMGLYGAIVVAPFERDYWPPAHREMTLTLDDVLIEDGRIAAFERNETNYVAMGRFGNVMLANGEAHLALFAKHGEVVRFYLVNTANTRVFNVAIPGAKMKLVGGDSGRYEREELVETVILAPSERAIIDVYFAESGQYALEHRTPHRTYELGTITVSAERAEPSLSDAFARLRINADMEAERTRIARYLDASPDKTLALVAEMDMGTPDVPAGASLVYFCPMHPHVTSHEPGRCPDCRMKLLARADTPALGLHSHHHGAGPDHAHSSGPVDIEWEDDMVEVNRQTTPSNTRWKLIDRATGAEGHSIDWRFRVGDQIKIRLVNEMESDHPMHHPFHIHGAGRFLILARNGVTESNLVWKDTVLVKTGETVDILLDVTNAGRWMAHCHIAEHHESGMMLSFDVEE